MRSAVLSCAVWLSLSAQEPVPAQPTPPQPAQESAPNYQQYENAAQVDPGYHQVPVESSHEYEPVNVPVSREQHQQPPAQEQQQPPHQYHAAPGEVNQMQYQQHYQHPPMMYQPQQLPGAGAGAGGAGHFQGMNLPNGMEGRVDANSPPQQNQFHPHPAAMNPPLPNVPQGQFVNSSLVNVKLIHPSGGPGMDPNNLPVYMPPAQAAQYAHYPPPNLQHPPFHGGPYNGIRSPGNFSNQASGGQYAGGAHPLGLAPPGYPQGGGWGQVPPVPPAQYLKQEAEVRALYESQAFVPMNNSDSGSETLADEWERVMTDFLPDMIITFKLTSGESEHFHQDVRQELVLIRGGFFESTDDHSSSIAFQIVSPSGKVVYKSARGEGLFKIQTDETGTYTFALSNGNWSGMKYVTFVVGSGVERSLSQNDISTLDGNIKVLYRMLGDMETQSTYLWLRQKSHLEDIKQMATQTYYALIVELGCTAIATIAQLSVIKKMVSHRRLF